METFYIVSECKTAVLFLEMFGTGTCLTIQLFWPLVQIALLLATADRLRLTINNRDRTRQKKLGILYTIPLLVSPCLADKKRCRREPKMSWQTETKDLKYT